MTPRPTPFDINKVQAVFDALDAYMAGTSWSSSNASVYLDGSGTTHSMSSQDAGGNNFTYSERMAGLRVSVQPPSASLGPGQTQQFTATATNPDGTPATGAFTWTLGQGALGTVDATGLYTAPATIATATVVSVTATVAPGTSWASASVSLNP